MLYLKINREVNHKVFRLTLKVTTIITTTTIPLFHNTTSTTTATNTTSNIIRRPAVSSFGTAG